jgi:uncharacterized protein YajQ (UPF0234 family)
MPTFDVVSKVDVQEVDNAVNIANKEIATRFDFKNTNTTIEWNADKLVLTITSSSEGRVTAAYDIFRAKAIKRGLEPKSFKEGDIKASGHLRMRQEITVQQGISQEVAKKIVKDIKDAKIKAQGAIQGDQLRFSGKNRDDLQEAIREIKSRNYELPLQFVNFRD